MSLDALKHVHEQHLQRNFVGRFVCFTMWGKQIMLQKRSCSLLVGKMRYKYALFNTIKKKKNTK